jgi:hypothetical protein
MVNLKQMKQKQQNFYYGIEKHQIKQYNIDELSEVDKLKITIKKNNEIIEKYEHEKNLAWENVKIAADLYKNEKKENEKLIKTLEYVSKIKNEEIEQLKKEKNKSILDIICDYIDELL